MIKKKIKKKVIKVKKYHNFLIKKIIKKKNILLLSI